MGTNAMLDLLKRLRPHHTVHGLRSTFTDWAAKRGYSMDLRETALAHALGNQTNRAYQRDELAEERRPMMQAWTAFADDAP
jgi:integrase